MRRRGVIVMVVGAVLSLECSPLAAEATKPIAGCRMLPTNIQYVDARVQVSRLVQDRTGCYFDAVAGSPAAAQTQKAMLTALATRRCGEVIASEDSAYVAGAVADAPGVPMRITLSAVADTPRCRFGAKPYVVRTPTRDASDIRAGYSPAPLYPLRAIEEKRHGEAAMIVLVDNLGKTIGAVLERSSGHADLDEAAVAAVGSWIFVVDGEGPEIHPVEVPIRFHSQ